jgi:hypothetical protein
MHCNSSSSSNLTLYLSLHGFQHLNSNFKPSKFFELYLCRNPSFELVTKTRACKGAGQEWSQKVTFRVPGNVGECEKMNPHTPKWAPILGIGVSMDFWILKGWLQGSKLIGLKSSLYHWKDLRTEMSKMGLHDPFAYLKHKLWPKEGPKVKLPIWFPITKSWELPWFTCVGDMPHNVENLLTRVTILL